MTEGTITYTSRMQGIEFDPMDGRANHTSVSRVELSAKNGSDVTYIVHLSGVSELEEALAIASSEVARVADLLSVNLGLAVTEPRLTEHALNEVEVDSSGKRVIHFRIGQSPP